MKRIFQFKKTTNPTDIVAEKTNNLFNNHQRQQLNNNNNTFSDFPYIFTQNLSSTCKRRFSENYYKSFEVHKRPRLVKKCGELNIHMDNVPKHKRRLFSDIFNTILDIKWRWHIAIFLLSFLISWFLFATIWYMIAFFHGDLKASNIIQADDMNFGSGTVFSKNNKTFNHETVEILQSNITNNLNKKHMPCVYGVHDFTSALLYSVETQHTIGYGLRHITEECSFAIIFLMLQSCFGIFIQGLVAGVVFAKISRPNKRKRTIIFSHNAVVSERDGKLCFMFKLANIRISQLSDARIKLLMIKSRRTDEGEFIPFQSYDMKVGHDWSGNDSVFFPWPKTVEHVIDETSPLYEICKKQSTRSSRNQSNQLTTTHDFFTQKTIPSIKNEDYEIVVILEGNIETTGASCHIRTSYLPQEILFGYRFKPIYPKFTDFEYLFDYAKFDQVEPFQYELFDLNLAFTNRHLNRVYDARAEEKNYNLTYQNTLQKNDEKIYKKESKRPFVSLASIFKNQQNEPSRRSSSSSSSGSSSSSISNNNSTTSTLKTRVLNNELRKNSIDENELEILNCDIEIKDTNNKTGRFTVCPVKLEEETKSTNIRKPVLNKAYCTSLVTMNLNERTYVKNSEKRFNQLSKQVLFQLHSRKQTSVHQQQQYHHHHRTHSLPPFNSNGQSSSFNLNEDEGYLTSNKNNSKIDLN